MRERNWTKVKHKHYMDDHCGHSMFQELICHLPNSILSVVFSLVVVSLISMFYGASSDMKNAHNAYYMLFHNFHFLHIIFAITTSIIMFGKHSKNIVSGVLISVLSSSFFCILSDVFLPYIGGSLLGVKMRCHVCFISDFTNISIFILIGIINGLAQFYSRSHLKNMNINIMHNLHVLVSALASTFYLVAHGFVLKDASLGLVFLMLMVAVVLPCTLSDVFVPIVCAGFYKKKCKVSD